MTLYHWDLPQALHERGGWLSEEVQDWFEEYADLCFREFGDLVKFWITLNEPRVTSLGGYGEGNMAPGVVGPGTTSYGNQSSPVTRTSSHLSLVSAHNQILAHGRAYRLYHQKYASSQAGKIGITLNIHWAVPEDPSDPSHLGGLVTDLTDIILTDVLFRGCRQGHSVRSGLVCRADPPEWRVSQRHAGEDRRQERGPGIR